MNIFEYKAARYKRRLFRFSFFAIGWFVGSAIASLTLALQKNYGLASFIMIWAVWLDQVFGKAVATMRYNIESLETRAKENNEQADSDWRAAYKAQVDEVKKRPL